MKMRVHPTLADACIHSLTQSCAHVHTRNHPSLGCCVTNTLRQPALRRQASWAPPELWMRTCSHMQSHRPLQIPWTWVHEPLDKNPQKPQRGHRMAGRSGPVTGCPCQPGRQVTAGNRSRDPRGQGRWTGQVGVGVYASLRNYCLQKAIPTAFGQVWLDRWQGARCLRVCPLQVT